MVLNKGNEETKCREKGSPMSAQSLGDDPQTPQPGGREGVRAVC